PNFIPSSLNFHPPHLGGSTHNGYLESASLFHSGRQKYPLFSASSFFSPTGNLHLSRICFSKTSLLLHNQKYPCFAKTCFPLRTSLTLTLTPRAPPSHHGSVGNCV